MEPTPQPSTSNASRGSQPSKLSDVLKPRMSQILNDWVQEQVSSTSHRSDLMKQNELHDQSQTFLKLLSEVLAAGPNQDPNSPIWRPVRDYLSQISATRSSQGFSPSETATFVFSLKQPIFRALQDHYKGDAKSLVEELWTATTLLDKLGLFTTEVYQKTREEVIRRQQDELLELSTPVVKLWDKILALPMIGTLDSARTQTVMESLLQKILETGSEVAIIDITGVPNVDTLVAQHLLKTVTAARLMGADCIISGIRPQIAQTIVHLGVELGDIVTKATLADAFVVALNRVKKTSRRAPERIQGTNFTQLDQ